MKMPKNSFVTKRTDWQHHGLKILLRLDLSYVCTFAMWLNDPRVLPSTQAWRGYRISADGSNIEYVSRLLFFICMAIILPH